LQIEKIILIVNNTWTWEEYFPDYPASNYKLRIILKSSNGSSVSIVSIADGNSHLFLKDKSDTAHLTSGLYAFQVFAISLEDGNKIYPIDFGVVEVHADITQSDPRTFAVKMVENLRATLLELSTKTLAEFSIDGRSYTYYDKTEVRKELAYWESKAGITRKKRILMQFTND
jgi:hypothetical protein